MSIILNFLPVSKGGGVQNAMSFLEQLYLDLSAENSYIAIARRDSAIHSKCLDIGLDVITVKDTVLSRLLF